MMIIDYLYNRDRGYILVLGLLGYYLRYGFHCRWLIGLYAKCLKTFGMDLTLIFTESVYGDDLILALIRIREGF